MEIRSASVSRATPFLLHHKPNPAQGTKFKRVRLYLGHTAPQTAGAVISPLSRRPERSSTKNAHRLLRTPFLWIGVGEGQGRGSEMTRVRHWQLPKRGALCSPAARPGIHPSWVHLGWQPGTSCSCLSAPPPPLRDMPFAPALSALPERQDTLVVIVVVDTKPLASLPTITTLLLWGFLHPLYLSALSWRELPCRIGWSQCNSGTTEEFFCFVFLKSGLFNLDFIYVGNPAGLQKEWVSPSPSRARPQRPFPCRI